VPRAAGCPSRRRHALASCGCQQGAAPALMWHPLCQGPGWCLRLNAQRVCFFSAPKSCADDQQSSVEVHELPSSDEDDLDSQLAAAVQAVGGYMAASVLFPSLPTARVLAQPLHGRAPPAEGANAVLAVQRRRRGPRPSSSCPRLCRGCSVQPAVPQRPALLPQPPSAASTSRSSPPAQAARRAAPRQRRRPAGPPTPPLTPWGRCRSFTAAPARAPPPQAHPPAQPAFPRPWTAEAPPPLPASCSARQTWWTTLT
jgi:hypothetical protein